MNAGPTARTLRALTWLRWRVLMNSITRSGARDVLERFSRTAESLLPIAVAVLLIPAGLGLLVVGGLTGSRVASDPASGGIMLQAVRWLLVVTMVLTLLGPMLLSSGSQTPGLLRLMLLPIPSRVLYTAHALGGVTDPWVFLTIPLLVGITGGAAANGAWLTAACTAVAGVAFLLVLLGIAALSSATLQLLVRNRRRAELLVLIGMLLVVFVSIIPSALIPREGSRRGRRDAPPSLHLPRWLPAVGSTLPSELYVRAAGGASTGAAGTGFANGAALLAWAAVLHGLTWPIYQRLLRTPASNGATRRTQMGSRLQVTLPGIGPRASAVTVAYVRLALRTPRGRTIILMPVLMLAVFGALFYARGTALPLGPVQIGTGYSLGIFGVVLALMSITPFAFNQFAVDGAGLTLQLLAPISTRELLYGKAIGGALIAAIPGTIAVAAGIATGAPSFWLWLVIVCGAISSYLLLAPVAAVLSLLFPRTVDLSSVGQGSNAHQAAGLLGVLAFGATCVPPVVLSLAGLRLMGSAAAAAALVAAWAAVTIALAYAGFLVAERLFDDRKENLALVAAGK